MRMLIPPMDAACLEHLQQCAPEINFVVAPTEKEALALAADIDASNSYCSSELLNAAPHRRWVQVASAGVELYPLQRMRARGITFSNAKGIYGAQLADHTLALILAFSRQLPFLYRAQQKEVWENRRNYPPGELAGQKLLIVGLGGAGRGTARRGKGFGLRILATRHRTSLPKPDFVDEVHSPERLDDLLPEADWVAVCVPLVPATHNLFHDDQFVRMKRTAYIVCVTRGKVINTDALVRALETRKIAGAGLDVTDPEPLPPGHPLWTMGNVIITPHASGHSPHADSRMCNR